MKGVVKSGEAYCLECKSSVDREVDRCPSCDSPLDEEVKAFSCPRCKTILILGTGECPQCGMKFKIKTLKQRLTSWSGHGRAVAEEPETSDEEGQTAKAEDISEEQLQTLRTLVESIGRLAEARADLLSRMKDRHADEKLRLAEMRGADGGSPSTEIVEAEMMALVDEVSDLGNLYASIASVIDEISAAADSFDIGDDARSKGLAAKAMKLGGARSADTSEIKAREDQLTKREEMVDRKIRGYASKRKELDDHEATLTKARERLEEERSELQRMREERTSADESPSEESQEWRRTVADIRERLSRMLKTFADAGIGDAPETEQPVESTLAAAEQGAARLLSESASNRERLKEVEEQENETKQLLKALDQLLGKLPEDVIQQFTQSDDYRLYERVLDRYKI